MMGLAAFSSIAELMLLIILPNHAYPLQTQ
jgi:hypothetical protein